MTLQPGQEEFAAVCPYLGLADDADSHATYSTEAHRCYKLPNPTRIATGHQETYCLGENHVTCPVFLGEGIGATATQAPAARGGQREPATTPIRASQPPAGARPRPTDAPAAGGRPPRRPGPGRPSPRPRSGGVSMPVATIALFAMAVVVIAIAFLIQQLVSDNGGNNLSVTDTFATTQARRLTATAQAGGGQQTAPPGGQTQQPGGQTPGQTAQPGQSVTPGTGTPATRTGTPGTGTPSSGKTYTVQAGDTCGKIAADNNITLQQLMQVNNITDPNCPINVGDVLKLP